MASMPPVAQPVGGFVWGGGGRRMSPADIERERQIAAQLQSVGSDVSPVGHWTQGLARVANALAGTLKEGRANRASEANAAENAAIMQALFSGTSGTPPISGKGPGTIASPNINPAITQALTSPYVDDATRQFAAAQYQAATKRAQPIEVNGRLVDPTTMQVLGDFSSQPEVVRLANIANDPSQPAHVREAASGRITAMNDPFAVIPLPGGPYVGPRSGILSSLGGGSPPSTLPPDFDFGEGGPASAPGGFPQ